MNDFPKIGPLTNNKTKRNVHPLFEDFALITKGVKPNLSMFSFLLLLKFLIVSFKDNIL